MLRTEHAVGTGSMPKNPTIAIAIATSPALKVLDLEGTSVTDAGLVGIERIATLEDLLLEGCTQVTNVTGLATSTSLKRLDLQGTSVTNAASTLLTSRGVEVRR